MTAFPIKAAWFFIRAILPGNLKLGIMKNFKSTINGIMTLIMAGSILLTPTRTWGQCNLICGSATISHNDNGGNPCGNSAIGNATIAAGLNSISDGNISFTFGEECHTATNATYAFAGGFASITEAEYSIVYGNQCIVHGGANGAYAGGLLSEAHEPFSWAHGNTAAAQSMHSLAFGQNATTSASANYSLAFGNGSRADGDYA
jgi:hypothetical protein